MVCSAACALAWHAAAMAAGKKQSTFESIIEDVVVQPGKSIAKAAKSAIGDVEKTAGQSKKKREKKAVKSRRDGGGDDGDAAPAKEQEAGQSLDEARKDAAENDADKKPRRKGRSGKSADKQDIEETTNDRRHRKDRSTGKADRERDRKVADDDKALEVKEPAKSGEPLPKAADTAKTAITPTWPKTVDQAKAEAEAAAKPPEKWSDEEITAGKEKCAAILKRIDAVAVYEPPLREGICGTPAPIQLISIGKNPEVAISPPATMTCELAEGLSTWLKNDLQPLARKHLGAEIIRIENMSGYACRHAYGRVGNKLSEHGVANALDIGGFVTSSAKSANLLKDWGTPQREILARIAAEKAAAEKAAAAREAADEAARLAQADKDSKPGKKADAGSDTKAGAPGGGSARHRVEDGVSKVTLTLPGGKKPPDALASKDTNHLGGPKLRAVMRTGKDTETVITLTAAKPSKFASKDTDADKAGIPIPGSEKRGPKSDFLRQAHAAACRIFGTTLGPEANAAHRNHFHVDMAPRKRTKICD